MVTQEGVVEYFSPFHTINCYFVPFIYLRFFFTTNVLPKILFIVAFLAVSSSTIFF